MRVCGVSLFFFVFFYTPLYKHTCNQVQTAYIDSMIKNETTQATTNNEGSTMKTTTTTATEDIAVLESDIRRDIEEAKNLGITFDDEEFTVRFRLALARETRPISYKGGTVSGDTRFHYGY